MCYFHSPDRIKANYTLNYTIINKWGRPGPSEPRLLPDPTPGRSLMPEIARTGPETHSLPGEAAPTKPLLRGWFHAIAAVGAVALTIVLAIITFGDLPRFIAMVVFGLSMVALYSVSAIYHMGSWEGRPRRVLRALDHSNIFLVIAGTYTPICVIVLSGWVRASLLAVIWILAL